MTARAAGPLLPFQPGKPVGNIYYGACSWTDRTLIDAGTFYPPSVRTAADRLAHYASQFPIVEVDATYYALPSERNAHLWVDRTPPGFVFNIKTFGLFTHHPVVVERLPAAVKELLPAAIAEKSRVYLRDIPEEAEKLIWEMQAQALAPLSADTASMRAKHRSNECNGIQSDGISREGATVLSGMWWKMP